MNPELHCPTCVENVPIEHATLSVSYSPMGSTLTREGALSWGDCFCDYTHLTCGTSVRLLVHKHWDETTFSYTLGFDVDIEAYLDNHLILLSGPHEPADPIEERFFSGNIKHQPEVWGNTLLALLDALGAALDKLHLESKGVADGGG